LNCVQFKTYIPGTLIWEINFKLLSSSIVCLILCLVIKCIYTYKAGVHTDKTDKEQGEKRYFSPHTKRDLRNYARH